MPNDYITRDKLLDDIKKEFAAYSDAHGQNYKALRDKLTAALAQPARQIADRQRAGKPVACAYQILLELQWLAKYRTDWTVADQRLADLQKAMANIDDELPNPVQGADGSWGGCYHEPYRKLEPTVDALQKLPDDKPVQKLAFMADLQDAKRTIARLWRLQISDIRTTGRNDRDELGALQTALSQLIFKDNLRDLLRGRPELGFTISRELTDEYRDFLSQTQHPRTGYWGPWYSIGGQLFQVQDLSFTFHTINYRQGDVDNWPLIVRTTLDIEGYKYPMGWMPTNGARYSHHNNYDVATIFMYGWPHIDSDTKDEVRKAIDRMLTWCIGPEAMNADGFKAETDTAPADTYYYGIRFLDRLGYWDSARRFWSRRAPPLPAGLDTPKALADLLKGGLTALDDHSDETETALHTLDTARCLSAPAAES